MFRHKKYLAVMIVCFLMGGFSLILSIISLNAGISFTLSNDSVMLKAIDSFLPNGAYLIVSSVSFIAIIYSAALILAGVSIFYLTNDREKVMVSKDLSEHLLSDDEKSVVKLIKSCGVLTQKEIEKRLSINKVRLSRVISRLCNKKILQKLSHGMTNKIILLTE